MDWSESSLKLLGILKGRAKEIRNRLPPPDDFLQAIAADIVSSGADLSSCTGKNLADIPESIQTTMIESLVRGINDSHRELISELVAKVGEIVEENNQSFSGDSFLGEEESSILMMFERMKVRIRKDVVLKILALDHIPD